MNLNYEINGSTYCPIGLYLPFIVSLGKSLSFHWTVPSSCK